MARQIPKNVTGSARRHFDFMQILQQISNALAEEETTNVKLHCMPLIPKFRAAKFKRAVDVFVKLAKLDKINHEKLEVLEEILIKIGRQDLVKDVLRPFLQSARKVPENFELQPRNDERSNEDVETSDIEITAKGDVEKMFQSRDEGKMNEQQETPRRGKITYGGSGTEPGKFDRPLGVVVSPDSEIFVVDQGNRRVQVHNTEGVYLRHFPTAVPGTEHVMTSHDVAMDGNGTLWVVGGEASAHYVVQYSKDGTAMTQFDLPTAIYIRGIAVDMRNNNILVTEVTKTDGDRAEVLVFRHDGSLVRRFGHPDSEMRHPHYITVDGEGNILVSDTGTHFVYKYDETGKFLLKFGGYGLGEGQLRWPWGICTDSSGHIIVAEEGTCRVQIFTSQGEYVRHVSTPYTTTDVALGPEGQLVVADRNRHRLTVYPTY